jgi:hypothetical protein
MAQGNQGELYLSTLPNNQFHLRPEVSKVRRRAQLQLCSQTQAGDKAVFKEQVMHNKFNPSDCCATADFLVEPVEKVNLSRDIVKSCV